jgi:hypothetical protein
MAIMAMTTSNSMRVKPADRVFRIVVLSGEQEKGKNELTL